MGYWIQDTMQTFMQNNNIRYAQVAVGSGGVQNQGSFTYSEADSPQVAHDDVFMLASVSKAFVSAAIYQLFPDEQSRLDYQVFAGLGFQVSAPDRRLDSVNIQMLLDYTAGFGDNTYNAQNVSKWLGQQMESAEDFIQYLFGQSLEYDPYNDPNHQMHTYSNDGYFLLSQIVARQTEGSYWNYVNANFNKLMGLNVIQVPTQLPYPPGLIKGESTLTGPPSYNWPDKDPVPAVFGGDGTSKSDGFV